MTDKLSLIRQLYRTADLPDEGLLSLLGELADKEEQVLFQCAREVREAHYGKKVFLRGLIEITNICKNNCYYCGIRCGNPDVVRYRLDKETILERCALGHSLGYRTFVLQGGEDPFFTEDVLCGIVSAIRQQFPDCAITLSVGERSRESYARLKAAGADRYLLRQETSDPGHYRLLHPEGLTIAHRKQCLQDLKELGYQVGCGIMVGSPFQNRSHILQDLRYMQQFQPHMIGIGPFVPHHGTPFRDQPQGSLTQTLQLLAILRLMFPEVLLPATTALDAIHPKGRELGLLAGANVIMPNLSPDEVRKNYTLYDNKPNSGSELAVQKQLLAERVARVGYQVVDSRGDHVAMHNA